MRNFWIACIVVMICRMLAALILPTFDDAFITYRYAFNLATDQGLVYNHAEKVMGTTAPLFAIIGCLPVFLTLQVQNFFVFFNLLCDLATLYLLYTYFFKSKSTGFFFLFVSLFAVDPMINRICVGGMEADLFLLASLSGLILYLQGKKNLAAVLLAAAYFLRPEAVILLFIVYCYEWYTTRKFPLVQGIIALLVLSIPLVCIYVYYGQILPQSIVAKSMFSRAPFIYLIKSIFFPDPVFYLIFPLAVYGYICYFRKDPLYRLAGIWIVIYSLAYIIKAPHAWSWYFFSIDVMLILFACFGVEALLDRFRNGLTMKPAIKFSFLVLPVLVWMSVLFIKGRSGIEKNIYAELSNDFNDPPKIAGKVIFADDIGALGYFTKAYIYDNQKLVTPQAALYKNSYDRIIHIWPDYLFLYCDPTYLGMMQDNKLLSEKYIFVKRYTIGGEQGYPDKKSLSNGFKQDYILFKRNY
jgi:hypothetical protein